MDWTVIDLDNKDTLPLDFDPCLCDTDDGVHVLQLQKYGSDISAWEWETCFTKPRNKSFPIDFVNRWQNLPA